MHFYTWADLGLSQTSVLWHLWSQQTVESFASWVRRPRFHTGRQTSLSLSAAPHTLSNWVRLTDSVVKDTRNKTTQITTVPVFANAGPFHLRSRMCLADTQDPTLQGGWQGFHFITVWLKNKAALTTTSSTKHRKWRLNDSQRQRGHYCSRSCLLDAAV